MIILPDRNISRTKFLMPMLYREWRSPLKATVFQYFIVQAWRWSDPHQMLWRGFFEDRDDADAFMWAVITGEIRYDRYLRRLPLYCPDFDPAMLDDPGIGYNLVSMNGVGPSSGNYGVPGDCNGISNKPGEFIDCIGAGGSGAVPVYPYGGMGSGGGGGGLARIWSVVLQPGGAYPYGVGSGGAAVNFTGIINYGNNYPGNPGGHTHFWHGGLVYGYGGAGGTVASSGALTGAAGGTWGAAQYAYPGGAGGGTAQTMHFAGGGGGAGGPNGPGSDGGYGGQYVSGGGNGNGNQIGANANGNWYGPWGPGGGGSGNFAYRSNVGGYGGGHYGGGGGASFGGYNGEYYSITSGGGGHGLLVFCYQPYTPVSVSSIAPTSGSTAGGTPVTISGAGFTSVSSVNIGGAPVTNIGVPHQGAITGITSAGGVGTYNVNVNVSDLRPPGTGVSKYSYVTPPSLSAISVPVGTTLGGLPVTLTGANLSGVNSVTFGGTAATSVVLVNATTITCVTPPHAAGIVNVVASNVYGPATLANSFTYILPSSGFNMMPI